MPRHTRYQGAIIRDHHILLIRHQGHSSGRNYWVLPGGGTDGDETEEECVIREMKEETNLDVEIEQLILDEATPPGGGYKRVKTFICRPIAGTASPGYEPEPEAAAVYSIAEVRWFDLRDADGWDDALRNDPFTHAHLERLIEKLGYQS